MSGGPGAATTEGPSGQGGSCEWRRIYDRVEALLPRVEELAADRARLEESNRTQQELSEAREKSLHARLLQAEASRMRWKTAYIELPLLADPKIAELQENDSEDSRKCKALLDVDNAQPEIQLKRARRHVELSETNVGYEDIVKDLRAELTKLRQAYETLSTNKDKEATEAAQKLQQNIEELQLAARKKDDRLRAKAFDAENKLKAMKKDKTALLRIKEVEGAQATEAKHKLQKNVEELQVAARDKDDEIRRLRAEALAAKNKLLVAEDKLDEIQKLEDGQLESLKRKRTSLPNASESYYHTYFHRWSPLVANFGSDIPFQMHKFIRKMLVFRRPRSVVLRIVRSWRSKGHAISPMWPPIRALALTFPCRDQVRAARRRRGVDSALPSERCCGAAAALMDHRRRCVPP